MRKKLFLWLVKHSPILKKDFLRYMVEQEPYLTAEIFCEDFLGIMPKGSVDKSAIGFLSKYKHVLEPWLVNQAYRLQKERVIYGDKGSFFDGALLVIRLLYAKTIKFSPNVETPVSENKADVKESPEEKLEQFLSGIKEIKTHGKQENSGSETAKV